MSYELKGTGKMGSSYEVGSRVNGRTAYADADRKIAFRMESRPYESEDLSGSMGRTNARDIGYLLGEGPSFGYDRPTSIRSGMSYGKSGDSKPSMNVPTVGRSS